MQTWNGIVQPGGKPGMVRTFKETKETALKL